MDDNKRKQIVFEQNEKSKGLAYLLWLLFGWLGVHRFYAGKTGSGLAQLLLSLSVVGFAVTFFWWLFDAFLIPDMINEHNLKAIDMIYGSEQAQKQDPKQGAPKQQPPEPLRELPNDVDARRQAMLDDLKKTGYRKERPDPISRLYR